MAGSVMDWLGGDFFFNGFARWQLWFDNPNKAAVLLAEVALIGLALIVHRRRLVGIAGVLLATASLYSLLRTFSRGGLVAFAVGCAPLCLEIFRKRERRPFRIFCGALFCAGAVLCAHRIGFAERMAEGLSGRDKSVGNRLVLWRSVPQMIHDAPFGWGWGRSGEAYMRWYQPLEREERYRTLVNSHLTAIVELGLLGGLGWTLLWSFLIASGCDFGRRSNSWLCLAEWSVLFTAGLSSSVCEDWTLWAIPISAHVISAVRFPRTAHAALLDLTCRRLFWGGPVVYLICMAAVMVCCSGSGVRKQGHRIAVGSEEPSVWIVPDIAVLGGNLYPRAIRTFCQSGGKVSWNIVEAAGRIPSVADYVVICGAAGGAGARGRKKTIWLSPGRQDEPIGSEDIVVRGEFSGIFNCSRSNVVVIAGTADYIPNWPAVVVDLCLKMR